MLLLQFAARVEAYVTLRRQLEATLAPLPVRPEPAAATAYQQRLARLIQDARRGAGQGELFDQPTRWLFRRLIARNLTTQETLELREALRDEQLTTHPIRVNDEYPEGLPLSLVPPRLLLTLPPLPEGLAYRFVGDHLILLDTHARLIVDFVHDAVPRREP